MEESFQNLNKVFSKNIQKNINNSGLLNKVYYPFKTFPFFIPPNNININNINNNIESKKNNVEKNKEEKCIKKEINVDEFFKSNNFI